MMAELWADNRVAERNAPSKPYPTDEWKPTDERLWLKVLMVAKGRKREMTRVGPDGPRTIHAPNHGRGFRHWPNPKATAWAVKQYNGYGGKWKGKDEDGNEVTKAASQQSLLEQMRHGAMLTTSEATHQHRAMLDLERQDFVQLVEASDLRREFYWDITYQGRRHVTASLGDELTRKIEGLLQEYDPEKDPVKAEEGYWAQARKVAAWMESTFRFKSPKTPRGQKDLKALLDKLWWSLANGGLLHYTTAKFTWDQIKPRLDDVTKFFSDEGGTVIPAELKVGSNTYLNRAGLNAATLEKYAKRLEQLWGTVHGWRAQAFKSGLKVAFASPRDFKGTASGRYKTAEDTLYVKTTPAVMKRGDGYGGFDYILVHELGHRYARYNNLPVDFDKPEWWTSKYSRTDSLAGSESFAELFAIGHYRLTGAWDPAIIDRFEKVMS